MTDLEEAFREEEHRLASLAERRERIVSTIALVLLLALAAIFLFIFGAP